MNRKKNKVDELPMGKSRAFQVQELLRHLSTDSSNEIFKEDSSKVSLSKSLVGGNTNICKARVLNFMQSEHIIQGLLLLNYYNNIDFHLADLLCFIDFFQEITFHLFPRHGQD